MNKRLGACSASDAHQLYMKRREHPLDLFADFSVTDEQCAFASKFLKLDGRINRARITSNTGVVGSGFKASLPLTRALHVKIERKVFQHGQDRADCPFSRGDVMRAMRVANGDVRPGKAGDPLGASLQRQH